LKTRDSKLKPLGLVLTILTGTIESTPSVQPYLTCFSLFLSISRFHVLCFVFKRWRATNNFSRHFSRSWYL